MLKGIVEKLIKSLKSEFPDIKEENFQFPARFGDISCNICFIEAKKRGKNPSELSRSVIKKIKLPGEFEKVEEMGGYLNFYFDYSKISKEVLKEKLEFPKKKNKVMVEFSQANTHKAFHIGHVRGTSLGESLSRILEFYGYKVLRANYQGDTGMHVAKWLWCYMKFHKGEEIKKDESWFASIYVEAVKKLSENEELQNEVDEINRKLDSGEDKKLNELWKKTRQACLDSLEPIYKDLYTKFDYYFFESAVEKRGKEISKELVKKGIAKISEGATIVDLTKFNLGVWVLLRKDGTVLYSAKDIALAEKKFKEYEVGVSVYVVGKEQEHHFSQLFRTLELMGFSEAKNCVYVPVSLVKLPWGKMSSRTGDNILYSSFKEELLEAVRKEILSREEVKGKELEKRALAIGIAAMKYSMLKQDPNKEIVFNKEEAVRFEGDTGPYIQYMAVRCNSILKKVKNQKSKSVSEYELSDFELSDFEKNLIRKIMEFKIILEKSAVQMKPNLICNYSFELATAFSKFYENCKVIGSDEENFRLELVRKTQEVLETSLDLLGIETPEKM